MRRALPLVSLGLVLIATWPILRHLDDAVPGEKFTSAYAIYRNALHHPPWTWFAVPFDQANFPDGGTGVMVALPQILVAWALSPAVGPTVAINLSLLLHLYAGLLAGAALARRLVDDSAAALYGAVGFGLSAFAVGVWATGQPENVGVAYVLAAILAGWSWLDDGRPRWLAAAAVSTALAFFSSPYLVMGPLLAAPGVGWLGARRAGWRRAIPLAAAVLVTAATCALPYRRALDSRETAQVLCPAALSLAAPADSSVELAALDLDHVVHAPASPDPNVADPVSLLTPLSPSGAKPEISIVYLGLVTLGLAAFACLRERRVWAWVATTALPLLVAIGPRLRLGGWAVLHGGRPVWLPLAWLRIVPPFSTIQAPSRVVLGASLPLVGVAIWALGHLGPRGRWAAALAVTAEALLLAPAHPPVALTDLRVPDAYVWLAAHADGLAVVDTPPLGLTESPPFPPPVTYTRLLFGRSVFHGHPVPYTGCYPPLFNPRILDSTLAKALVRVAKGEPVPSLRAEAHALAAMNVGWIVWHGDSGVASPEVTARLRDALDRSLPVAFAGDARVYALGEP